MFSIFNSVTDYQKKMEIRYDAVSYTHLDVYKRQALAIATETYGLQGAVSLRVIQNVFGVVFALAFCVIFYWFMSKKNGSCGTQCTL